MDDQIKIDFQVVDGKLTVGEQTYYQGIIRTFYVSATELKEQFAYSIIERENRKTYQRHTLSGKAHITGDALSIIGAPLSHKTTVLDLSIECLPDGHDEAGWHVDVFYLGGDWEIGYDASWNMCIYLSKDHFSSVLDAYRTGRLKTLGIGIHANFWVNTVYEYAPLSEKITWYVAPDKDGKIKIPDKATGTVVSFHYSDQSTVTSKDEEPSGQERIVEKHFHSEINGDRYKEELAPVLNKIVVAINALVGIAVFAVGMHVFGFWK